KRDLDQTSAISDPQRGVRRRVFFFFREKTAYEVETGLEFRRVLFRSEQKQGKIKEWRKKAETRRQRQAQRRGWGSILFQPYLTRSEERRVGKESRSWSRT